MVATKVPYEYDGRKFEGMLVYDDSVKTKRPAIFMQPDWLGVCPHAVDMAHEVAGKDYVVLLADMFGVGYGDRKKEQDELMKTSRGVRGNLPFLLGCGAKAYEALTAEANKAGLIDTNKKGAIGFCIGGGFALEQARAGADFKGTVVFHVTTPNPIGQNKPNIKGRVLALHGAADPVTPKDQMDAFEKEMTDNKIDWQVMMFGHAVHSFCDVGVNNPAQRYDEKLAKQSYRMMRDFFAETL
jgi:dienelactone hydrolase